MVSVVIVEDEPSVARVITRFCQKSNIPCKTFTETKSLIDYIEENNIIPENYLVDMKLRNDMTGSEEIFHYLKKKNKLTNFFYMAGNLSSHDQEVIARTGAPVILKPFSYNDFLSLLKVNKV